jgi:hypothetical protein
MLKGFKDFLLRGNIVDLATAVVVGTAFAARPLFASPKRVDGGILVGDHRLS